MQVELQVRVFSQVTVDAQTRAGRLRLTLQAAARRRWATGSALPGYLKEAGSSADLPGVSRISEDRRHRAQRPTRTGPVRVTAGVGGGRARDPGVVQGAGDPRGAMPRQPPGEHPRHDW